MGIINVTPDSFSGDGLDADIAKIVEQALRFESEGADFLDCLLYTSDAADE